MSDTTTQLYTWREGILHWNNLSNKEDLDINIEISEKATPLKIAQNILYKLTCLEKYLQTNTDLEFYKFLGEQIKTTKVELEKNILTLIVNTLSAEEDSRNELNALTPYFTLDLDEKEMNTVKDFQNKTMNSIGSNWQSLFNAIDRNAKAIDKDSDTNHGTKYICTTILDYCTESLTALKGYVEGNDIVKTPLKGIYAKNLLKQQKGDNFNYNVVGAGMGIEISNLIFDYIKELAQVIEVFLNVIMQPRKYMQQEQEPETEERMEGTVQDLNIEKEPEQSD